MLGLRIELADDLGECSGMLLPTERLIRLRADEVPGRHRFTIAHELGHWIRHALEGAAPAQPTYCRAVDVSEDADCALEREANIFAAELLMRQAAVMAAWDDVGSIEACSELLT